MDFGMHQRQGPPAMPEAFVVHSPLIPSHPVHTFSPSVAHGTDNEEEKENPGVNRVHLFSPKNEDFP